MEIATMIPIDKSINQKLTHETNPRNTLTKSLLCIYCYGMELSIKNNFNHILYNAH